MYKRIVVPLDGSKLAEEVLIHVRALASALGSEIILMRVTTYPSYEYLLADPSVASSLQTSLEGEAGEYLNGLVDSLRRAPLGRRRCPGTSATAPCGHASTWR